MEQSLLEPTYMYMYVVRGKVTLNIHSIREVYGVMEVPSMGGRESEKTMLELGNN